MNTVIAFCAKYIFAAGPLLLVLVWFRSANPDRRTLFLRTLTVGALCAGLFYIAGQAYYEQRPFVALHLHPWILEARRNGFPSAGTLCAAACAFVILPYSRITAIFALLATACVAWSRVVSLAHTPLDVVAALVIAAVAALLGRTLVRRRPKARRPDSRPGSMGAVS